MRFAPTIILVCVLFSPSCAKRQATPRTSLVPEEATPIQEPVAPPDSEENALISLSGTSSTNANHIGPGGWERREYAKDHSDEEYIPTLTDCTTTVQTVAKRWLEGQQGFELIREEKRRGGFLMHFRGPDPFYYVLRYNFDPVRNAARLSLLHRRPNGMAQDPIGQFSDLKPLLSRAFDCKSP